MPKSDEQLVEIRPFDVYAMLQIMTFIATGVAIFVLNKELEDNWYSSDLQRAKKAINLTKLNKIPDDKLKDNSLSPLAKDQVELADIDKEEYILINKEGKLLDKNYPSWYKPTEKPILVGLDNDNSALAPDGTQKDLIEKYKPYDVTTEPSAAGAPTPPPAPPVAPPVAPPATPPVEAPK